MKLYFGYLFTNIAAVRALGINEWAMNEGLASKFTALYCTNENELKIAEEYGLTEAKSLKWYVKEKIEGIDWDNIKDSEIRCLRDTLRDLNF